jgi:hypothetical protein
MHMILAVALDEETGVIERAWWRPGIPQKTAPEKDAEANAWTGPPSYADASDIAQAIRAGNKVFAWIHRGDGWRLGPSVVEDVDDRGRAGVHLDGSPDAVDEALIFLAQNWTRREIESD